VGAQTAKYKEIYRDPPDANPGSQFTFNFRVSGLQPGTTYLYRIRGVNGYGPGEFCYKTFTTYPAAPRVPRIIKVTSTSVTLRWIFSAYFLKRHADLRNLFSLVDSDHSGSVSREELAAVLDDKISSAPDLRDFLVRAKAKFGIPQHMVFYIEFYSNGKLTFNLII
jgi:hypothetical protein